MWIQLNWLNAGMFWLQAYAAIINSSKAVELRVLFREDQKVVILKSVLIKNRYSDWSRCFLACLINSACH